MTDLREPLWGTAAIEVGARLAEQRHQLDPCDMAFADLAATHPDACATGQDYPNWTPGRTK